MSSDRFPLARNILPQAPPLRRLIGPSFIILGLGLGSGEVILWPYLASNYGLGIIWGALIGITFQFFVNMEVERYALIYGESIFVGFTRMFKWLPLWFIFSTFAGFGWPGIGLAGTQLLGNILGIKNYRLLGVMVFALIGLILSIGKVLYETVEKLQKYLILFGVPFIFLLTLYLSTKSDFLTLGKGLLGVGEGFSFLPAGISLMTFLGALAYSGAGGNLNLAQSFYVRDKGYGMGKYAPKIKSIFRGEVRNEIETHTTLSGTTFDPTNENLAQFTKWWRAINIEHFVVFWLLGLFTMLLLALLAYSTTFGLGGAGKGISFISLETNIITQHTISFIGTLFLLVASLMLLSTQLVVLESTSRISTENILLMRKNTKLNVPKTFYTTLWIQIMFGILVFSLGFDEPRALITLGAVFNAFAMFIYIGLLLFLNNKTLEKPLRPSFLRNFVLAAAFIFFGVFSTLTIFGNLAG